MSYTITLKFINDTEDTLTIIEKTCQDGAVWTERGHQQTLSMPNSGTSGLLRFQSSIGEKFIVATGVHNYARWCDILVDLDGSKTAMRVHPTYYTDGDPNYKALWNQATTVTKTTAKGKTVGIYFYKPDSNNLLAVCTYA
ncbi:fungal fruit body lectin [Phaeosphaeriaceae sp. PMI808]|nr:fungal fruit body lectin [Phaeosphaeriaceae sp. PMI808]